MTLKDLRDTPLYRETEALCLTMRQPGTGQVSDVTEIHAAPDARHAAFSATVLDRLEGSPPTRIGQLDLATGRAELLSFGPHSDRLPKYAPDGRHIAFLSDRAAAGDFQLYLLDRSTGAARRAACVDGWVEYFHWSPEGQRIVLGVAGHGADVAGGQGAITSKQQTTAGPAWLPTVETGTEGYRWRRAWVYDVLTDSARCVSPPDENIWEVAWCGNDALVAVVSPGPEEGLWYSAQVNVLTLSGNSRPIFRPQDQVGVPSATPSGKRVAIVEAVCSDRGVVAGELRLLDATTGAVTPVDTRQVDVTHVEWRSETKLLVAGHRGFDTVVGIYDCHSGAFREIWCGRQLTAAGRYITPSGLNEAGDCVLAAESFTQGPQIGLIREGRYQTLRSFDLDPRGSATAIDSIRQVTWSAPDGLELQGWLLLPKARAPLPLVMNIHGGPIAHWRPHWLGRPRGLPSLMLVRHGFAVFFPNPRGSSGRGQAFARRVVGDMGGADTQDYLSGVDSLIGTGIVDPARVGVTGVSYGGYMSSWLVTQDPRFAAAVPVSPLTNQVTEHLLSNIPHFVRLFLADTYTNPTGKYFRRSPIMHAHKVRTPTLSICGALDRCTPPQEAAQFHNALLENEVRSVLVTYPEEGHGVRKFPAAADYTARVVEWFEQHMASESA